MYLFGVIFALLISKSLVLGEVLETTYQVYSGLDPLKGTFNLQTNAMSMRKCSVVCSSFHDVKNDVRCDAFRYHGVSKICELMSLCAGGSTFWENDAAWKVFTRGGMIPLKIASPCENGWFLDGTSCYTIDYNNYVWNNAQMRCEYLGGHLVTIANTQENDFIVQLLTSHGMTSDLLWIGGVHVSNEFEWVTNEEFNFTAFADTEPNGNGGCVCMLKLEWHDYECTAAIMSICEKSAK